MSLTELEVTELESISDGTLRILPLWVLLHSLCSVCWKGEMPLTARQGPCVENVFLRCLCVKLLPSWEKLRDGLSTVRAEGFMSALLSREKVNMPLHKVPQISTKVLFFDAQSIWCHKCKFQLYIYFVVCSHSRSLPSVIHLTNKAIIPLSSVQHNLHEFALCEDGGRAGTWTHHWNLLLTKNNA